jgi:hypothetical protein
VEAGFPFDKPAVLGETTKERLYKIHSLFRCEIDIWCVAMALQFTKAVNKHVLHDYMAYNTIE